MSECLISQVGRVWDCLLCPGTKGRASVPTAGFKQALPFPGSSNIIQLLKLVEALNSPFKLLNKSEQEGRRLRRGCRAGAAASRSCQIAACAQTKAIFQPLISHSKGAD